MFLTCIFEYFGVDLNNETQENIISSLKDGGAVKQLKEKGTKATKNTVMEEEDKSIPPSSAAMTSSSHKYLVNDIVKNVLQKFVNLTKYMIKSSQQARKHAIQNENSFRKSQS
ncbi:hypothetical protein AHAS_Ahas11G0111600 [Arachis hypogaea]